MTALLSSCADLEIQLRGAGDAYAVELRFSPDGNTDHQITTDELAVVRFDFDRLRTLELNSAAYGRLLGENLFADPSLLKAFDLARMNAHARNIPLRLRLFINSKVQELHHLRWETLCDPQDGTPFLMGEMIRFSRYLSSPDWRPIERSLRSALRALVVIANPNGLDMYQPDGRPFAPIDVEGELERARAGLDDIPVTALASAGSATLDNLAAKLRDGYDILYLVCHGALIHDQPRLWLENAAGNVDVVAGGDLITRLHELEKRPRLIVLASCQSGGSEEGPKLSDAGGALTALGPRLMEAGISAVVAMQGSISMATVERLMPVFFRELAHDGQIDRAMAVARGVVRERFDGWMPVLWMRVRDGQLWTSPLFRAAVLRMVEDYEVVFGGRDTELATLDDFLAHDKGYDKWRAEQNQRLTQSFQSEAESHAHFGQILNIGQEGIRLIERREAWERFDSWFSSWKDDRRPIAVLGEEGDGKTWAVASWVQRKITQDSQCPAVIFLSSIELQTNEPLDIIVQGVAQCSGGMSVEQVRKRVEHWLQSSNTVTPQFLLVLDGINEQPDVRWWRALLERLNVEPWSNFLAVIVTCRAKYWQNFASLRSIKTIPYTLQPYNDRELDAALAAYNLRRADIHPDLLDLAQKPRYFDLLVRYRERLAESGDITVTRLIYEDWRDRLQRKRNLALSDNDFQDLLRELAIKYLSGEKFVNKKQLIDSLPFANEQVVEELLTSGIFLGHNGKFQVQPPHLSFSLALLLVEQVEDAARAGNNVAETIAGWLEPHAAMDIKAQICEAAALRALEMPDLPTSAKVALLHAWLTSQNIGPQAETNLSAYFPIDPRSYFELAEAIWSNTFDHARGQQILMRTFLRWIQEMKEASLPLWRERFERWLGFVHRFYYPYLGQRTEEEAREIQQAMTERLGAELELGSFAFAGYQLTAIDDDGLMRLGRVALGLISHAPREPFIHALATCCVAEAIMDSSSRSNELAWIIRTSPQPLWNAVRAKVEQLLKTNNRIAYQAAHRLLSFVGTAEAHQIQEALPDDLFPPNPLIEKHKSDPCMSGFPWQRQDCERCVTRTDLAPDWLARQIKSYCIDPYLPVPEDIGARLASLAETIDIQSMQIILGHTSADHDFDQYEAALCAYAPEILADVVRRLARHITEREGMALRQLSLFLKEHSLILTYEECNSIYQAWASLHAARDLADDNAETAERHLFSEVLKQLNAQDQLSHLLNRPEKSYDLVVYDQYFQPITVWENVWQLLATAANPTTVTRLLRFISVHPAIVPPQDVDTYVVPLLAHDDSYVRAMALWVIFASKVETSLNAVVHRIWAWHSSYHYQENMWGSLILCEHGSHLSFSDVAHRIHPVYIDYAVRYRGNKTDEVTAYAEMLHRQWLILGAKAPELAADFPSIYLETFSTGDDMTYIYRWGLAEQNNDRGEKFTSMGGSWGGDVGIEMPDFLKAMGEGFEQRQQESIERVNEAIREQVAVGNEWFAHRFFSDALDQVLCICPDLVDQWVSNALSEQPDATRRLQVGSTFYEALCKVLLQADPERGLALYRHLQTIPRFVSTQDSNSKILLLDYALFRASSTVIMQQAWEQRLEQSTTDQELLTVVIAAQAGQGRDWLWSYIVHGLQSDVPITYLRALTLLGLVDTEASYERLSALQTQVPDTWVRKLVNTSLDRWQRNTWAKHWFRQFLTTENDIQAWAAFRLFLRCVDRRFWVWQSQIISEVGSDTVPANRVPFLKENKDTVENKAKKNEKAMEEQFLGHKIKNGQLWPWML